MPTFTTPPPTLLGWSSAIGTPTEISLPYRPDPRIARSAYREKEEAFLRTRYDLSSFRHLGPNWDSYGAEPPSAGSMQTATAFLWEAKDENILPSKVLPSAEGGVGVCFVENGAYAQVEFLNSGEASVIVSIPGQQPEAWEITIGDARTTLHAIKDILQL